MIENLNERLLPGVCQRKIIVKEERGKATFWLEDIDGSGGASAVMTDSDHGSTAVVLAVSTAKLHNYYSEELKGGRETARRLVETTGNSTTLPEAVQHTH